MTPCLGHLAWEILPGRSCLGPWAPADARPAEGKSVKSLIDSGYVGALLDFPSAGRASAGAHGPRQELPGKISQARCPRQGVLGLY